MRSVGPSDPWGPPAQQSSIPNLGLGADARTVSLITAKLVLSFTMESRRFQHYQCRGMSMAPWGANFCLAAGQQTETRAPSVKRSRARAKKLMHTKNANFLFSFLLVGGIWLLALGGFALTNLARAGLLTPWDGSALPWCSWRTSLLTRQGTGAKAAREESWQRAASTTSLSRRSPRPSAMAPCCRSWRPPPPQCLQFRGAEVHWCEIALSEAI